VTNHVEGRRALRRSTAERTLERFCEVTGSDDEPEPKEAEGTSTRIEEVHPMGRRMVGYDSASSPVSTGRICGYYRDLTPPWVSPSSSAIPRRPVSDVRRCETNPKGNAEGSDQSAYTTQRPVTSYGTGSVSWPMLTGRTEDYRARASTSFDSCINHSRPTPPGLWSYESTDTPVRATVHRWYEKPLAPRPPAAVYGALEEESAERALELWNILDRPRIYGPAHPRDGFAGASVAMARKGRRFAVALMGKRPFPAARQEQKSHERARRHRGNPVLAPEAEFLRAEHAYVCRREELLKSR